MRISFTGDIMCTMEQLDSLKIKNGSHDYYAMLKPAENIMSKSNLVVGNLETPIAGKKFGLTDHKWSFNSSVDFGLAIKKSGIDTVTTANNHCLDRGVDGLLETLKNLDEIGLHSTGTNASKSGDRFIIKDIEGIKIGILSYTYGTNAKLNQNYLSKSQSHLVNLFQYQEPTLEKRMILERILYKIRRHVFILRSPVRLLSMLREVKRCRRAGADYVIMCLHSGGQYNYNPEKFTKWITKMLTKNGVDFIVGNHEHVVHPIEINKNNTGVAFSLGNFLHHPGPAEGHFKASTDLHSDYSILLHIDLGRAVNNKVTSKQSFSIMKNFIDTDGVMKVSPAYDVYVKSKDDAERSSISKDMSYIVNKVSGGKSDAPCPEYNIRRED